MSLARARSNGAIPARGYVNRTIVSSGPKFRTFIAREHQPQQEKWCALLPRLKTNGCVVFAVAW